MRLRYTADANMDEPALRDVERWKDKIEVRLDNRQVFFLFFGSALVACMLFVLGVIVGKRIESRGRADAPEIQDPLAVLDRVNQPTVTTAVPAEQGLAFPKALIGGAGAKAKPIGLSPRPPSPPIVPPSLPATKVVATGTPAAARNPEGAPPRIVAPAAQKPIGAAKPPAPALAAKSQAPAASKSVSSSGPIVVKTPPGPKTLAVLTDPAGKGKFTLQLSSFPDRGEADAFARRFTAQGAFIITSEIPGKGTWYRVRMGNYASAREATAAKAMFERQHNLIAYVAAR